jgi:hypothetical protein
MTGLWVMSDKELSRFEVVQRVCDRHSKRRRLKCLRPAVLEFVARAQSFGGRDSQHRTSLFYGLRFAMQKLPTLLKNSLSTAAACDSVLRFNGGGRAMMEVRVAAKSPCHLLLVFNP